MEERHVQEEWHVHVIVGGCGRSGFLTEYCLGRFGRKEEAELFCDRLIDDYFDGRITDSERCPSALKILEDFHIRGGCVYHPFVTHVEEIPSGAYCDAAPE